MFGKRMKTFIACMLAFVVAAVTPAQNIAAAGKTTEYVKEFRLYIAKNDKSVGFFDEKEAATEAKEWFEANGYHMIEGNINSGASGMLNKEVGVYMGYSTTTDRKEAVTDIAVMNEKGNYSASEYKEILKKQKDQYRDLVKDMKTQLEEYRKNVNAGVKTAIQARDYMNTFVEDDSGKPLGDLLTYISDDDLVSLLLQANGKVVLMIQEKLAYACDTGKSTWLERMEKLGGYDKLYKQYYKAYNNDATKATKAIDQAYSDKAKKLLESWDDINSHTKSLGSYLKENGLEKSGGKEVAEFIKSHNSEDRTQNLIDELSVYRLLNTYIYGDTTLLGFFLQDKSVFNGTEGIRKLYPFAASLTDGQQAGINESVSLFTMVLDAASAMAFNDNKSNLEKKLFEKIDEKSEKEIKDAGEKLDNSIKEAANTEKISVYDGVDRDIYKDGVAVTSTAKTYSKNDNTGWVNALVGTKAFSISAVSVLGGTALFGALAANFAFRFSLIKEKLISDEFHAMSLRDYNMYYNANMSQYDYLLGEFGEDRASDVASKMIMTFDENGNPVMTSYKYIDLSKPLEKQSTLAKNELYEKALADGGALVRQSRIVKGLAIGFSVAFVLLAVFDITMTGIVLYNYYNVDHLPIPHHMVDLSYNESKETSFINYKSVLNQDGGCGDLNGNGGKQWLALYQTHDEDAGDPIIAPGGGVDIKVVTGSDKTPQGYSPLHMFGTPNVVQNLTYADGDNGYSYNDSVGGTYLFFMRDDGSFEGYTDEEPVDKKTSAETDKKTGNAASDQASGNAAGVTSGQAAALGTAVNGGYIFIAVISGLVAGIFIGVVGSNYSRRRRSMRQ